MNFSSDNAFGGSPEILAALSRANAGSAASYGADAITARLAGKLSDIFEREVAIFPVATGTAANSLALATLCPPHGGVVCHAESHIVTDECGAPEFFSGGARLIALETPDAKLTADAVRAKLAKFRGDVHQNLPSALSLTQSTELGTVYSCAQIAALSEIARGRNMRVHMDGARFANALVHLGCSPAEMTWKAGIDVLSFGATKNGALGAECVIFFNPAMAGDFAYRRKRAGHLFSKMRFLSAQLEAYLENDLWLSNARKANELARMLADGLAALPGVTLGHPAEANAVFAWLPRDMCAHLRKAGATFYDWEQGSDGRVLVRLVCAFATPEEDVAKFIASAAA